MLFTTECQRIRCMYEVIVGLMVQIDEDIMFDCVTVCFHRGGAISSLQVDFSEAR